MSSELLLFFFFKQKTAYEMRISDWSSDVCSSDLINRKAVVHAGDLDHPVIGAPTHALHRMVGAAMTLAHFHRPRADRDAQHLVPKADAEQRNVAVEQPFDEIGRAHV